MPTKTKTDYLNLPFAEGENKTKTICEDAVANKGLDAQPVKYIKKLADGQFEICLAKGGQTEEGIGATKHEAMADAAGKF